MNWINFLAVVVLAFIGADYLYLKNYPDTYFVGCGVLLMTANGICQTIREKK